MWPFNRKPLCILYRAGIITNADVHLGVMQALQNAGLTAEADEFDTQFWQLTEWKIGDDFAQAVKRLAKHYVRVRVE